MAGIETNTGVAEKFIFRYFRYKFLLIEIGTKLIRRLFEVKVGHDLTNYLASNTTEAQTLRNLITTKKITQNQAQYLPPVDMKPDSSNFDITLLTCLLRNVCGLKPHWDTVWVKPLATDTSEEADIARLRLCRNWLMHRDTLALPEAAFDDVWQKLSGILHRLNRHAGMTDLSSEIDFAKHIDINDELQTHKYIFQYDYLLKTLGTKVLRAVFDQLVGKDFGVYLTTNKTESARLNTLINSKKTTPNQEKFLPPAVKNPTSEEFDITLLNLLLRNVCGLRSTNDHVWRNPAHTDVSVEADITRLQECRNSLLHITTVYIHEEELTAKWRELRAILMRLNRYAKIPNIPQKIEDAYAMLIDSAVMCAIDSSDDSRIETDDGCQLSFPETDRTIFQLRSQLIKIGTAVLQKHFDYRVGNDFANYLTSNEAEDTKLHWLIDTNRIAELQVTLLPGFGQTIPSSYDNKSEKTLKPPSDQTPSSSSEKTFSSLNSSNFDISLLTVLLRYVCGLRAPNDLVWKEKPEDKDMSIEADISRLGNFRNSIMTLKHVDELGKKMREILTRLGRGVGIKDDLFSTTDDAQFDDYLDVLHMTMLEEWYANDQRDIKLEQEYAQTDFIKDSDDDAWIIDEENVSVLLSEGKLPNAKHLKTMCEKFGSSSRTVRKVCAYICNTLQMTSHHIKRCWPAYVYDKNNETDTNLVTFVAVKYIKDELNIDQIFGYNIYELFHGSHSAETSEMIERDIENADRSDDKMDKVGKCVNNHSLSLMRSHSNITLIAGSTVKSIGYMYEKEIIEKPCVAIYVHKKGYIPLGEEPFKTKLDEFDTDVRECVVSSIRNDKAYEKHDKLLMGTSIGNSNRSGAGTLGGFVVHPEYGLCGLTCAHVLCAGDLNCIDGVIKWSDGNPDRDVIQPASEKGTRIGEIVSTILKQDSLVGIDIALFCIQDRFPNSGQFAIDTPADLWTHDYNSGNIMRRGRIEIGADCIKYGSKTGRTKAKLFCETSCLRTDRFTLHGQMMVDNKQGHFSDNGDSGALAFVEVEHELKAIGVVVGKTWNKEICFLTPLSDILDALNEGNTELVTMKQFEVADNEQMQE